MNMTMHATVVIYMQKSVPLLKYINEISILKRKISKDCFILFFYFVIHISSHRYAHWPTFMQYVLHYDCLDKTVTS